MRVAVPRALPEGVREQALLFCVMLATAVGTTGLQSVLPAIGRSLHLPDPLIALAFSLSALLYALAAPAWAKRLGVFGAKRMVQIGNIGFISSMVVGGLALTAGLRGVLAAPVAFVGFVIGRGLYGLFGSAAPPAAQAMVVAITPRENWTKALSLLASAFGLGTILGPALAPFFVFPFVGLAGPAYAFALLGIVMAIVIASQLRNVAMAPDAHAVPSAEPTIGGEPSDVTAAAAAAPDTELQVGYRDQRIWPWILVGLISGHAQAIAGQTLAFLVIDRLGAPPAVAQPLIGMILMGGALAALLAQWGVIPRLDLQPRAMVFWGSVLSALGCLGVALATNLHGIAVGFALASLGFGFLRPGFTAGASLAVGSAEQGVVAGRVAAVNGFTFVLGPSLGIFMYDRWHALPYLVSAAAMAGLVGYAALKLREP
ncbi:MAG: MFS transporter [Sphingomonadaceae bacterium]|nr:MFS transporter [Sphingomonadaceae bacterium]